MGVMMKCGCVSQAVDTKSGAPRCFTHFGIDPGAAEIDPNPPSLEGRLMRCSYSKGASGCPRTRHGGHCCKAGDEITEWNQAEGKRVVVDVYDGEGLRPSQANVAFFSLGSKIDQWYCGCFGWD